MNKIHIIVFYRTDGIEYVPTDFPAMSNEDEIKNLVNRLNKCEHTDLGMYGYITKELI